MGVAAGVDDILLLERDAQCCSSRTAADEVAVGDDRNRRRRVATEKVSGACNTAHGPAGDMVPFVTPGVDEPEEDEAIVDLALDPSNRMLSGPGPLEQVEGLVDLGISWRGPLWQRFAIEAEMMYNTD